MPLLKCETKPGMCNGKKKSMQINVKKPFDLFISNGLNQLWQSTVSKFRTAIPLYEAEILDNLDLLEEFLNDLQSQHS